MNKSSPKENRPPSSSPDEAIRQRALDPRQSFIVQAPAGAGKTSLLVQRMLVLLAEVERPQAVLAITFTRKAAGEMRSRLWQELQAAAQKQPINSRYQEQTRKLALRVLENDHKHGWQLLKAPWSIRVKTMDSFWKDIVRQTPLTARLSGEENLLPHPKLIYLQAARNLMSQMDGNSNLAEALKSLVRRSNNRHRECEKQLVELLEKREQWLPLISDNPAHKGKSKPPKTTAKFLDALENVLQQVIQVKLSQLQNKMQLALKYLLQQGIKSQSLVNLVVHAAHNAPNSAALQPLLNLTKLPTAEPEQLEYWRALGKLLLTKTNETFRKKLDKNIGFPTTSEEAKKDMTEILGHLKDWDNQGTSNSGAASLENLLAEVRNLCRVNLQPWERESLETLQLVLRQLSLALKQEFEAVGGVDYTEIMLSARPCLQLGNHVEQARLVHLLVDEFQDTSIAQFDMLSLLVQGWQADGRQTLFLVGDPMQSIYRFRKAEAGLFVRVMERGLGKLKPQVLKLSSNFRSVPALVDWHNRVFQKVFPQQSNLLEGTAAHVFARAVKPPDEDSGVEWKLADDSTQEAKAIVEWIKQASGKQAQIAILFRSKKHVETIVSALREHGVPFQYERRASLLEQQEVLDILALLRALLLRHDTLAWMSVLRAPWGGFSLATLTMLAEKLSAATEVNTAEIDSDTPPSKANGSHPPANSIWEILQDPAVKKQLSSPEKTALMHLQVAFEWAWQQQGRLSLTDWLEQVWLKLRGPACLTTDKGLEYINLFLEQLRQIPLETTVGFFERLKDCLGEIPPSELPPNVTGKVAVLSIHQAKGLEFDWVVLPALERRSRNDYNHMLCWEEYPALTKSESHLLLAPAPVTSEEEDRCVYKFIQQLSKGKNDKELARLLYVGCTRARQRLLLTTAKQGNPISGTMLKLLHDAGAAEDNPTISTEKNPEATEEASSIKEGWLWRLPQQWEAPPPLKNVRPQGKPLTEEQLSGAAKPGSDDESENNPEQSQTTASPSPELPSPELPLLESQSLAKMGNHPRSIVPRGVGVEIHRWLEVLGRSEDWDSIIQQAKKCVRANLCQLEITAQALDFATERVIQALLNTIEDPQGRWILQRHATAESELRLDHFALANKNSTLSQSIVDRTFVAADNIRWVVDFKTATPQQQDLASFLVQQREKHKPQLERYANLFYRLEPTIPLKLALYFPLIKHLESWDFTP